MGIFSKINCKIRVCIILKYTHFTQFL